MNICVLDDNKTTTDSVSQMAIHSCSLLKISDPGVFRFTSPKEFLAWLDQNGSIIIDVCFLDIYLKNEMNGLDLARIIKNKNYHTLLVFMTSYDNYFTEMVQVEPFRFLSKPFQYEDFHRIFIEVYHRVILKNAENKCMYPFKNNGITFSVNLNDIVCISSYKRKIFMKSLKNETIDFYGKLDQIESEVKLLTNKFVRIGKSYLINTDFIDNIGKNSVTVHGVNYNISPQCRNNIKIIT